MKAGGADEVTTVKGIGDSAMQVIRKRFRPKTRASQPVMGSTTALLTR